MPAFMRCAPFNGRSVAACALLIAASTSNVSAQLQTIAELSWDGFSAGPLALDFPPTMDDRDIWVLEDFQTDRAWLLDTFSCDGAAPGGGITGFNVIILDALPPEGKVVMRTTPGTGRYVNTIPWGWYENTFNGQRLEAGSYWIMWAGQGTSVARPVMFVTEGEYNVGMGVPDNALQYNPGGGWSLPGGTLDPVTSELNNKGYPVGINFTLSGEPAPPVCGADFNSDDAVNSQDFFDFLTAFFASDPSSDFNEDETVNSQDFFDFLDAFFEGC